MTTDDNVPIDPGPNPFHYPTTTDPWPWVAAFHAVHGIEHQPLDQALMLWFAAAIKCGAVHEARSNNEPAG